MSSTWQKTKTLDEQNVNSNNRKAKLRPMTVRLKKNFGIAKLTLKTAKNFPDMHTTYDLTINF